MTYGKILFVGKDQEKGIAQFVFVQHSLQFLTCLNNTISVIAVNDEDNALCILEVVSPQGPDLVLSTNVPHRELNVLVFDRLYIEACYEDGKRRFRGEQRVFGRVDIPMVGIVVLPRSAGQSDRSCNEDLHNLPQLQLVQDGRFPSCVKTNHQDSHFLLSP